MTQAHQALAVANEVRLQRSAARQRVRDAPDTAAGMCVLADELEAGRTWPHGLRVDEALGWPSRSMLAHRRALLSHAGCTEETKVAKLSERQRVVLCDALRSPVVWRGRP